MDIFRGLIGMLSIILLAVMTGGMATIAGGVMAAYVHSVSIQHSMPSWKMT